jgi:hypothetical protein
MKKRALKKLSLGSETLHGLNPQTDLRPVAGGSQNHTLCGLQTGCVVSCNTC